jgi:hypothetical protein
MCTKTLICERNFQGRLTKLVPDYQFYRLLCRLPLGHGVSSAAHQQYTDVQTMVANSGVWNRVPEEYEIS